jgi:hypothetical protein
VGTAAKDFSFTKFAVLGVFCLALLGVFDQCLLPILRWKDPKALVDQIPIGSKLTALESFIGDSFKDYSVWERVAEGRGDVNRRVQTRDGEFFVRKVEKSANWLSESPERPEFSGMVLLFNYSHVIPDDHAPSYVIELVYVDGVLEHKSYGFLPG